MSISFSSLLISVLSTNLIIMFLGLIILSSNRILHINPKYVLLCVIFIVARCVLPCEFFYTFTITSARILPLIQRIGNYNIPIVNIAIYYAVIAVWLLVAVIKFVVFFYKQWRMESAIGCMPNSKYMPFLRELVKQKSIKGNIDLVEIPGIETPAIVGIWKTKIIIPANLPKEDLQYILLHELEHYKCGDLYFIAVLHLVCIIYWWNPLFYILKSYTQKFIELRVDSEIVDEMDEHEKICYLESILNVAKFKNNKAFDVAIGVGFYKKQSELYKRFNNVLNGKYKRNGYAIYLLILSLVILSTFVIIEPYSISKKDKDGNYIISNDSYFIKRGEVYDLYIDGSYFVTTDQVDKFEEIKIIMEEKNEKIKKSNN